MVVMMMMIMCVGDDSGDDGMGGCSARREVGMMPQLSSWKAFHTESTLNVTDATDDDDDDVCAGWSLASTQRGKLWG